MRVFVFCFYSLLFPISATCQLQNASFEDWTIIDNIEEPAHWKSNNLPGFISVKKEYIGFAGSAAARIRSNGISFEGFAPGRLDQTWVPPVWPEQIRVMLICDTIIPPARAAIELYVWKNGLSYFLDGWEAFEADGSFQEVIVPVNLPAMVDSLTLRLTAITQTGPLGYEGYASFVVDEVVETAVSAQKSTKFDDISVYPNPLKDRLHISGLAEGKHCCQLFSLTGQLMMEKTELGTTIHLDCYTIPKGIYFLWVDELPFHCPLMIQ